jgi:hypothetical protein
MFEDLIRQFIASGDGQKAVSELVAAGLTSEQAQGAVTATAESASKHLDASALLGSILGGAGTPGRDVVDQVTNAVASRIGVDPAMARQVVDLLLPKLIAFVKGRVGVTAGA